MQLTVPASLAMGLGPECARTLGWTKEDKLKAFEWAKQQVPGVTLQNELTYEPVQESV